jgi:putative ABC transport system substrate-binding protein
MKMRRRKFITLVGSATAAWPLASRAQQRSAVPVIGYLGAETPDLWASRLRALREGLSQAGYVEGRNVVIEYRWAEGQSDRLPMLASDLVRLHVSVIVAGGTPPALAAKAATSTIPVVFTTGNNPVELGLVASLNRPGGNLTGATALNVEMGPKRLELLHELVPKARILALLVNPTNLNGETLSKDVQAAAQLLGLELHIIQASAERDFDAIFASLIQLRAGGLVIATDGLFIGRSEQLAAQALRHAVPTIFAYREFAAAGGLMSYGGSITDDYRLVGGYVGRILKGEKPSDLPVQQATRIELIINMKTAKTLGLTFPITLLGRADEVIE